MRALQVVPTAAALFLIVACEADTGLAPTPVPTTTTSRRVPASIAVISGRDQGGKAGEPLAAPFVVRVTDADGNPSSGIAVSFRITAGAGVLGDTCEGTHSRSVRSAQTDSNGIASTAFIPTMLGRSTVSATVADVSVTFAVDATALVIEFWFGFWGFGFVGPCSLSSDITVPVGSSVEWKIPVQDDRYPVTYTVTSTSTPPGAQGFDSGLLTSRDRFRFVPSVVGTWRYRDQVTGLIGTLSSQ
jgi:hypothetical protein